MDGSGRLWTVVDGCGRLGTVVDGCGWLFRRTPNMMMSCDITCFHKCWQNIYICVVKMPIQHDL